MKDDYESSKTISFDSKTSRLEKAEQNLNDFINDFDKRKKYPFKVINISAYIQKEI